MARFFLAVVVSLLAFSTSGVHTLVVSEPCSGYEQTGQDSACPPTCVTCGCSVHAVEAMVIAASAGPDAAPADVVPDIPRLPKITPGDILHVPKTSLA